MWGPQMEAPEYVGHPFYQWVNAILISLLLGACLQGRDTSLEAA